MENAPKQALSALALASTGMFALGGIAAGLTTPFYLGLFGVAIHYSWQISTLDIDNRDNCWQRFKANRYLGLMLALAILAGKRGSTEN